MEAAAEHTDDTLAHGYRLYRSIMDVLEAEEAILFDKYLDIDIEMTGAIDAAQWFKFVTSIDSALDEQSASSQDVSGVCSPNLSQLLHGETSEQTMAWLGCLGFGDLERVRKSC